MAQVSPPGVHDSAVGLSNNVLSKREPIPALVLCWGWLLKQVRLREHCSRARLLLRRRCTRYFEFPARLLKLRS